MTKMVHLEHVLKCGQRIGYNISLASTLQLMSSPSGVSQPHFEGVVRLPLTLPKMGFGSPLGLLETQSAISGVKTPRLVAFFILLERS